MFPYSFPAIVLAWTMLVFILQNPRLNSLFEIALLIVFLWIAKKYYNKKPKDIWHKMSGVAYNIAILPLLFINIQILPHVLNGEPLGDAGMVYLLPLIYSPVIYLVSLLIFYIFLWIKIYLK